MIDKAADDGRTLLCVPRGSRYPGWRLGSSAPTTIGKGREATV